MTEKHQPWAVLFILQPKQQSKQIVVPLHILSWVLHLSTVLPKNISVLGSALRSDRSIKCSIVSLQKDLEEN